MTCTDQNKQIEDSIEVMRAPEAGVQAVSNLQMRMFNKASQIMKTGTKMNIKEKKRDCKTSRKYTKRTEE